MKVIITTAARSDLAAIGDYIAIDNPIRAASFAEELIDRCEDLGTMAERFQLVQPFAGRGIRRCPHKGYLIFYRIVDDAVEVLHVLHGAQDWEQVLFDDTGRGK